MARFPLPPLVSALLALTAGLASTACGDAAPRTIDDVRDRPAERGMPRLGVPADERLGLVPPWTYDAPATWTPAPSDAPGRIATFRVGPGDDAPEVSLSTAGGTVEGNVDRWRGQMGLPPEGAPGVAALPRKPFLGRDGLLVDLRGTYGGMGGAGLADARLLALLLALPGTNVALKLAGPATVVDGEAARFFAFAATLRSRFVPVEGSSAAVSSAAVPSAAVPSAGGARAAGSSAAAPSGGAVVAGGYRYVPAAGWIAGPEKPMRLATYFVGGRPGEPAVEVSLHEFGAVGSGVRLNVNRWRSQFGLPDATPEEVDALPRLPMLGGQATTVELAGRLTDPMRGVELDGAALFGAIVDRGDRLVFVKVTGPADAVRAARADVEAFCRALEEAP